ncbi:MAG: hypothetical protein J7M09_06875 [Deltaproteobacteria bacterium]|nr:hypothetical protein [Candidatus Tharpella sp.]
MECDRCGEIIETGDEKIYNSETLCDDCYMDVLSPTRICDPWAVRHAKACLDKETTLTMVQQQIIKILTDTGGITMSDLSSTLNLKNKEIERNLATLRHMEKIKARPENGEKLFCLW